MLNKEIEKAKTIIRKLLFNEDGEVVSYIDFRNSDNDDWSGYTMEQYAKSLDTIFNYIEQLETREQKLIEKLEIDIEGLEILHDNYIDANVIEGTYETLGRISEAQKILKILKGENE